MKKFIWLLSAALVFAVVVSTIGCSSLPSNETAIRMMKMVPRGVLEFGYTDVLALRSDDDLAGLWSYFQNEMFFGENIDIYGHGDGPELFLIEGEYVEEQMTRLNQTCNKSYEYKGVKVWQDEHYDVVFINGTCISGGGEIVIRCIDVVNGEQASLYDKLRDIVDRLPNGISVSVVDFEAIVAIHGEQGLEWEGLIAEGSSVVNEGENNRTTKILKFEDADSAKQCIEIIKSSDIIEELTSVTQDGVFVKEVIVTSSH